MTTSEQEDKEVDASLTEGFRREAGEDHRRHFSSIVTGTDRKPRDVRGEE